MLPMRKINQLWRRFSLGDYGWRSGLGDQERRLGTRATHYGSNSSPHESQSEETQWNSSSIALGELVAKFRMEGHLAARIDPLDLSTPPGMSTWLPELQRPEGWAVNSNLNQNSEIIARLSEIYCHSIGYEISHVESAEERRWLYSSIEHMAGMQASGPLRVRMARRLIESEVWDQFMATRFGQVKRYGLEGGESLMVAMDVLLQSLSQPPNQEETQRHRHIVIGMAHRGRLNLLVGLLGFPPEAIFHKLAGNNELPAEWRADNASQADVLSHLSHSADITVAEEGVPPMTVTMLPNPSHLEAVNPVQLGVVYALQSLQNQPGALAVQIHGDAAFSGQGIAQETIQLSRLSGFSVGGTIHIVLNNQLGYTATAAISRSARYASAPAHLVGIPILHVNGERPEEVARAMALAIRYREQFQRDILIDLLCYRRHGHNELDEPSFTQPLMYRAIAARETLPTAYGKQLVDEGLLSTTEVEQFRKETWQRFDVALKASATYQPTKFGIQKDFSCPTASTSTGVELPILDKALQGSIALPPNFNVHGRLQKFHIDPRQTNWQNGKVDWATAEALAMGTLLQQGFNVRLVGQDVQRGTFSQRHVVFIDQQTGESVTPFASLTGKIGGKLQVYNSILSELGVLGFEYGVSIAEPNQTLTMWEAQFGDFFNGAQVIFDTFLSCGRSKWGLQSPLTVLLPHGYDGTGPEHSSSRLERFLQMTNAPFNPHQSFTPNWLVAHPTTPANYFHLLRRQLLGGFRCPLIVASPKTLLRLPMAISSREEFLSGQQFCPLLDDPHGDSLRAKTLVLCSGKLWYELDKERHDRKVENMAIVRIEELCPLPTTQLVELLAKYKGVMRYVWCQEEHQNMGPYSYVEPRLSALLPSNSRLEYVGRVTASAPAIGYSKGHKQELAAIFDHLFLSTK